MVVIVIHTDGDYVAIGPFDDGDRATSWGMKHIPKQHEWGWVPVTTPDDYFTSNGE